MVEAPVQRAGYGLRNSAMKVNIHA